MPRCWLIVLCITIVFTGVSAQDNPLTPQDITIAPEEDLYGQQVLHATGTLLNDGPQPLSAISLEATAYDAAGSQVGAGFGYLVNACGAGLLPDFVLQPGAVQFFAIPLELFEDGAVVERVEVNTQGSPAENITLPTATALPGITQLSAQEVVNVEWIDSGHLRFGVGCQRDLFNDLSWYEYDLPSGVQQPAEHPKASLITEALKRQLGLLDPLYFAHSFLTFAPNARRMLYQTELNTLITAEPDGSFKRVLFEDLSNRTLQGITWLEDGRFLAYFFGAYGDPVLYLTASVDGQVLSEPAPNAIPSLTVPGASPDGLRLIITAVVDGKTGYYLKRAAVPTTNLLFEAEAPGNNWPGALFEQDADGASFVYAALPINGQARLACFNLQTETLHDLAALPLQLASDERAWWWLSPDHNRIALAANGVRGGLWLIELDSSGACA